MRFMGIDLGTKRTGIAVGDDQTWLASPVCTLDTPIVQASGNALLNEIERTIWEHLARTDELVFGLPINMDDTESHQSKIVRAFADRLRSRTNRTVHFQDERLTTAQANWQMSMTGMTRDEKKAKRDALAAANILRDFLEQRRRATQSGDNPHDPHDTQEPSPSDPHHPPQEQ